MRLCLKSNGLSAGQSRSRRSCDVFVEQWHHREAVAGIPFEGREAAPKMVVSKKKKQLERDALWTANERTEGPVAVVPLDTLLVSAVPMHRFPLPPFLP